MNRTVGLTTTRTAQSKMSDEDLVRHFVAHSDSGSFQTLVERWLPRLRRMLYSFFAGERELIEDAEQEILARLSVALPRFRFASSFGTFFYRFSRNTAIGMLRSLVSERTRIQRVAAEGAVELSPHDMVLADEARRDVLQALSEMSSADRILLHLREFERLPLEDIATTLQCPVGTVKSRLHRVRKRLRKKLERRGYE